jgi:sigma-54 specific flagellar transcriptional regulator A
VPKQTLVQTSHGKIIGHHPSVRAVVDEIAKVARTRSTVLITGENGTGKELAVAALHDASERSAGPLISFNCSSIVESLFESELFGHVRGAFTGAVKTNVGYITRAEGGTLFLDEVGELSLPAQAKLLRLIQEREYTPVGSTRSIKFDVRLVAATNRDLEQMVKDRTFREDLYYRLHVVRLHLPPLRERGSDVELLALFFLQHYAVQVKREGLMGYEPGAMDALREWRWPGNIRELGNAIERAVIYAKGPYIAACDLPQAVREHYLSNCDDEGPPLGALPDVPPFVDPSSLSEDGLDLARVVRNYEMAVIARALELAGHNRTLAARLLNVQRTTLIEKIRRYGIRPSPR